jgi:15-cis-phytoene synthase
MSRALDASNRFCGRVARREARNFYFSFLLLPPDRRRSMCALYAFMRHTDDLADDPDPHGDRAARLDHWRRVVAEALDGGRADAWPGLPALVATVERHEIPRRYLAEVIDGVAMDLHHRPFPTFDDLYAYCYRVASAVGLSCLHIWGFRSDGGRAEALAESCGIALQLTNIIRDVREDAERGRIYLPQDDLGRFGVAPEELIADRPSDGLRALLAFEARRAYDYYDRAASLSALVAPVGRPVLGTIAGIYRALLDEIVRRDYDVLRARVSLPPWRKMALVSRSLATRFTRPGAGAEPKPTRAETEAPRC